MSTSDEDFLAALRATFDVEAQEHVQAIATGVLALEQSPAADARRQLVETVFRAAHSLKGAARAVDFTAIEALCGSLEDTFAGWKRQASEPPRHELDGVHRTLDAITASLAAPGPDRGPVPLAAPARPIQAEMLPASDDTVRISVAKLDAHVLQAEEMLTAKASVRQRAEDLGLLGARLASWKKDWTSAEPDARALRQSLERSMSAAGAAAPQAPAPVAGLLAFLERNLDQLHSLDGAVAALAKAAEHDHDVIGKLVDDLLEDAKTLLLLPFATLAALFPKLVRDLCRDQRKEADLAIHGDDVEIDKRILEEMKAPLIHLLRNAVDHGIETPDERRRAGKPARATIRLGASRVSGNKVELIVADDGAGIDAAAVAAAAVDRGILSAEAARQLNETEAARLIFETEVSTSPMITSLSGRGLGLAIVREKAEKLGGTVSVDSRPGHGTTFAIVLPSTLATFRGVLVEAAQQIFVVPTVHVERVGRVRNDEIRTVEGRDTIALSGRAVAVVSLAAALECAPGTSRDAHGFTPVVVLGAGEQRVAFAVDAVLDEQEVLVKPLRKPLVRVRNIAGATVLGSGQVVPILNVIDLLKSAGRSAGVVARAPIAAHAAEARAKSVLVAEDSITSRMLLKSILESAGYTVKTAVDGMEAFTLLRAERFDLVVSDVEMPRLDGFGLTGRIRADPRLAELPVVLVTALETREDRERGIDVGASAYIAKGSFDQSNLLDAVRRLI